MIGLYREHFLGQGLAACLLIEAGQTRGAHIVSGGMQQR